MIAENGWRAFQPKGAIARTSSLATTSQAFGFTLSYSSIASCHQNALDVDHNYEAMMSLEVPYQRRWSRHCCRARSSIFPQNTKV